MRPTPKSRWAEITVYNGYDQHSVRLSGRTLERIQSGKLVRLRGQGFHVEGRREADFWTFNATEPGSILVDTDEGREVFEGNFADEEVWTSQVGVEVKPDGFRGFLLVDRSLSRFAAPLMARGVGVLLLPSGLLLHPANPDLGWMLSGRVLLTPHLETWRSLIPAYRLTVVELPRTAKVAKWIPALLGLLDSVFGDPTPPTLYLSQPEPHYFREVRP